jgi:hypothetical protein
MEEALWLAADRKRWVDLDEFITGERYPGYSFIRDAGLPSALD